jgi:hypothetical protein
MTEPWLNWGGLMKTRKEKGRKEKALIWLTCGGLPAS